MEPKVESGPAVSSSRALDPTRLPVPRAVRRRNPGLQVHAGARHVSQLVLQLLHLVLVRLIGRLHHALQRRRILARRRQLLPQLLDLLVLCRHAVPHALHLHARSARLAQVLLQSLDLQGEWAGACQA